MLKIRLQRVGRINMPAYRVVVIEHTRAPKAGDYVEKLGTYNPKSKEKKLDVERIKYWLSKGAQASGTVHNMLVSAGVIDAKKINVLPKKHPPVKEAPAEATPEAPTPAAESSGETASDAESTASAPETAEAPAATE